MGSDGKGGKTRIFEDVQISAIFPDRKNIFRKKLLSYKAQTRNNLQTIKQLIINKTTLLNVKKLQKFGFIQTYNGDIKHMSRTGLELYLTKHTKETNIKVQYRVERYYKWWLGYTDGINYHYNALADEYVCFTPVASFWNDKQEHPVCEDVGYVTGSICRPYGPDGCILKRKHLHCDPYYEWYGPVDYKMPTDNDILYETFDFIDWKIKQYLDMWYPVKEEHQQTVFKNILKNKYTVNVIYNIYNIIEDKWYKPIIENNTIKQYYDIINDTMFIDLINIDDSDDTIRIEYPIDDSVLCGVIYTSEQNKNPHVFVDYYEKVATENRQLHFFTIPVKHNGHMIPYKHNAAAVWLNQLGIKLEGDPIGSSDVKDVLYTLLSKYNASEVPLLDKYLKYIYGDYLEQKTVKIDTGAGVIEYRWSSLHNSNMKHPQIYRDIYINGYKYSSVLDTILGDVIIQTKYNNEYNCCQTYGKVSAQTTEETQPMYLLPMEYLETMPLKDFFNIYYGMLYSIAYARKEVHLKWYQTEFFQFVLLVTILVIEAMTGQVEAMLYTIASFVGTQMLISFGMDPTTAAIIMAVVTLGMSLTSSSASVAASSTTSAIGADLSAAAANSMLTTTVNTLATAVKYYTLYDNYKNNKKLKRLQREINTINTQIEELSKKLDEVFKNSFHWVPRGKFDMEYDLLYSDPTINQIALDTALQYEQFDIIDRTLQ